MIEEITIKFGTKLKPTQHSWKSQLYKMIIWKYTYANYKLVTMMLPAYI